MPVPYLKEGLALGPGRTNDPSLVGALQRDLRALGYLASGLDGAFGSGTARAVEALQFDLLHNDGKSHGGDGSAPVSIVEFNRDGSAGEGRLVTAVNGVVDFATATCIDRMLADDRVFKLPSAFDPAAENRKALEAVATSGGLPVPMPFVLAIATQESGAQHYHVPQRGDDRFIVLGLDHNDPAVPARVTSRGYGLGRYTLFHHPPRPEETGTFIIDPVGNVRQAARTLRDKFDHFVVASPADRADDRAAEHPLLPLRECRYAPSDPRYLRDCRACASAVGKVDIVPGMRHYAGAASSYEPNQYYASATYFGVPNRAAFLCDWPYAVRRYNGSGNSSFNYQARVLLNLLHPSA